MSCGYGREMRFRPRFGFCFQRCPIPVWLAPFPGNHPRRSPDAGKTKTAGTSGGRPIFSVCRRQVGGNHDLLMAVARRLLVFVYAWRSSIRIWNAVTEPKQFHQIVGAPSRPGPVVLECPQHRSGQVLTDKGRNQGTDVPRSPNYWRAAHVRTSSEHRQNIVRTSSEHRQNIVRTSSGQVLTYNDRISGDILLFLNRCCFPDSSFR